MRRLELLSGSPETVPPAAQNVGRPELLAPAGSPEAVRAAVQSGADAVYLGWGEYNARGRARGFTDDQFREALTYCHARGVRVFLTLNTLLTDAELPKALEQARTACRLGVDAVLVQDWGLFDLLRTALPDLPLHASTQMSVFTAGGAELLRRDGCERIVMARECSRGDIASIRARCAGELEIFVHGALCVCCSGQCAMSAVVGGRSGNRGRCAQPCRLPCAVRPGGQEPYPPAKDSYALSLKDMSLARHIPELTDLGVDCLKLEGRLKRPEYVAVVTDIYARLLREHRAATPSEERELDLAFSRSGFTDGYWTGGTGPSMFGVRRADEGRAVREKELFARAKALYEKDDRRTVPVRMRAVIAAGVPCALTVSDDDGHEVTVRGPVPEAARTRPLTGEDAAARLQKTGGTVFRCDCPVVTVEPGLSLSAGAVNGLRRAALDELFRARTAPPVRRECPAPDLPDFDCAALSPQLTVSVTTESQLRSGILDFRPARVYVPLELLSALDALPECGESVSDGGHDSAAGTTEWCAILPRVWRDKDEPSLRDALSHAARLGVTGALVGNIGQLALLRPRTVWDSGLSGGGTENPETEADNRDNTPDPAVERLHLYGDYGLNVFNARSLDYLRQKGLSSACVSFELRMAQIRDMRKILPAEALVYGRLPLMVTENRPLRGRRRGRDEKPSGSPDVLVDRTGTAFPLLDAFGDRTEIQNSRPLWLADRPHWRTAGLAFARLRFTVEPPEACVQVLRAYIKEERPGGADSVAPSAFTRGLYERGVE